MRQHVSADYQIFAVRLVPGSSDPQLALIRPGSKRAELPSRGKVSVRLQPGGSVFEGKGERSDYPDQSALEIDGADATFLDRLAASSGVSVEHDGKVLTQMDLPGSDKAVSALRSCVDGVLKQWGIDTAALSALQRQPELLEQRWYRPSDYPKQAFRNGMSGTVVLKFQVDAEGRVSNCTAVASPDHDAFDEDSCELLTKRARYRPALDSSGRPVAVTMVTDMEWSILDT
jgi:TonB family protein